MPSKRAKETTALHLDPAIAANLMTPPWQLMFGETSSRKAKTSLHPTSPGESWDKESTSPQTGHVVFASLKKRQSWWITAQTLSTYVQRYINAAPIGIRILWKTASENILSFFYLSYFFILDTDSGNPGVNRMARNGERGKRNSKQIVWRSTAYSGESFANWG